MKALELKMLVSENKLKKVIKLILSNDEISRNPDNVDLFNEIIVISRHYSALEEKQNELNVEQYNTNINQITKSLLNFIGSLPEWLIFESLPTSKNHQLLSIKIAESSENFDANDINRLIKQLSNVIGNKPKEFTITAIKNGSIILNVLLPNKSAFKFIEHYNKNRQSKFYRDLKIESVGLIYFSIISYFVYFTYKIKRYFSKNRKFYLFIILGIITALIVYYPISREYYKTDLISNAAKEFENVMDKITELENIVTKSSSISEKLNKNLEFEAKNIDGGSIEYSEILLALSELDKNAKLISGIQIKLEASIFELEKSINPILDIARKNPQNQDKINSIESGYEAIKIKLRTMNDKIQFFKTGTSLMITLVNILKDVNSINQSEKDKIIYAANSASKSINMIKSIDI